MYGYESWLPYPFLYGYLGPPYVELCIDPLSEYLFSNQIKGSNMTMVPSLLMLSWLQSARP